MIKRCRLLRTSSSCSRAAIGVSFSAKRVCESAELRQRRLSSLAQSISLRQTYPTLLGGQNAPIVLQLTRDCRRSVGDASASAESVGGPPLFGVTCRKPPDQKVQRLSNEGDEGLWEIPRHICSGGTNNTKSRDISSRLGLFVFCFQIQGGPLTLLREVHALEHVCGHKTWLAPMADQYQRCMDPNPTRPRQAGTRSALAHLKQGWWRRMTYHRQPTANPGQVRLTSPGARPSVQVSCAVSWCSRWSPSCH